MSVSAAAVTLAHGQEPDETVTTGSDGRDHADFGGEADGCGLIRSKQSLRNFTLGESLRDCTAHELGYGREGVGTDKGEGLGSQGTRVRIRSLGEVDERRQMKAAVYYETGGPEVFSYEEIPDPVAPPGGVLVKVEAISVEGGDSLHRAGGEMSALPHVVGYQCAGTVVETGPGVADLGVGDRVVTVGLDGSHAELRAAPEGFCWKIPEGLSTEEAACIPVAYGTAYDCLFEFGRLKAGESVLVQAGASGVGIAAIQFAKRAGARVLATASSESKLERLREYGLDVGINYTEGDLVANVLGLTDGRGVDVVIESTGGPGLAHSLDCLGYRGRCVSLGDAGRGAAAIVDVGSLRPKNLTLSGYFMGAELLLRPGFHESIARIIEDVASGEIRVVIDRRFPLSEAAEAHRYIESRKAFGRVVLVP
jgi:NADPH:quinone reductase